MDYSITTPSTTNLVGTTKVNLGGVAVCYNPQHNPNTVLIDYTGILHNSGAAGVYLHTGTDYGYNWQNLYDYPMRKTVSGWQAEVPIQPGGTMNFCFKDSASNWDNNTQHNWSITLASY